MTDEVLEIVEEMLAEAEAELGRDLEPDEQDALIDDLFGEEDQVANAVCDCDDCVAANAGAYGNPQSVATGRFKPWGSGTGKGECHEAAQAGAVALTDQDRSLGKVAQEQVNGMGVNPASWVEDEGKWERAKAAADSGDYDDDTYWAVVAHVYRKMGGGIKANEQREERDGMAKLNESQRKEHVAYITANCSCWKGKGDAETLNALSDDKLAEIKAEVAKQLEREAVANAAAKGFRDGNRTYVFNAASGKFVRNEFPPKKDGGEEEEAKTENEMAECEEGDEECVAENKKGKPAANQKGRTKPQTLQEWEASMPAEARAVWNAAKEVERGERGRLLSQLTANMSDADKARFTKRFGNRDLTELRELLAVRKAATVNGSGDGLNPITNWSAMPDDDVTANSDESLEELADMPDLTSNWAESASPALVKASRR